MNETEPPITVSFGQTSHPKLHVIGWWRKPGKLRKMKTLTTLTFECPFPTRRILKAADEIYPLKIYSEIRTYYDQKEFPRGSPFPGGNGVSQKPWNWGYASLPKPFHVYATHFLLCYEAWDVTLSHNFIYTVCENAATAFSMTLRCDCYNSWKLLQSLSDYSPSASETKLPTVFSAVFQ